jgi:hypothetical protein
MPPLPAAGSAARSAKAWAHFEYMAAVMERLEWDLHTQGNRISDLSDKLAQEGVIPSGAFELEAV